MRVVIQRVERASVTVDDVIAGQIRRGLLAYVGIEKGDTEKEIVYIADKVLNMRIFPDERQRMNLSVKDIGGAVLSISQFTLASRTGKGRRPDFTNAGDPVAAETMWRRFNELLAREVPLQTGIFGAMMMIDSLNAGPVTFIVERSPVRNSGEVEE